MKSGKTGAWLALLLACLIALPATALADDTELFTASANPNVLLMLDTTGSMADPAGSSAVGDLDGDGDANTRMDALWKVVYTLLNADLSKPDSTASASGTLAGARAYPSASWDTSGTVIWGGSHYYDRIRLGNFTSAEFDMLPSSGTVEMSNLGVTISVPYTSKGTGGRYYNRYYYLAFSPQTFADNWSTGARITYSVSGTYATSYPLDHTQAASDDFLNNLTQADEEILKARLGLMTFTTNPYGTNVELDIRNWVASDAPNDPPFSPSYENIWSSVKQYAHASGGTPTAQALDYALDFFDHAYNSNEMCRQNFAVLITDGEDTMGGIDGATGNGSSPEYYHYSTFYPNGYSGNTGQVGRNNAVIKEAADLLSHTPSVSLFTVGLGLSDDVPDKRVLRDVMRRAAEQANDQATTSEYAAVGASPDNTARAERKAFFATDATELATSLRSIFQQITAGMYSFTAPTVASVRMTDRNYLYKASFSPSAPPATFWEGHLEALALNDDGTMTSQWDADNVLKSTAPADRHIFAGYTSDNVVWSRLDFTKSAITPGMLSVDNTAVRDAVVDYVRGVGHDNNAKLGDIFHSKPVVVGPPSQFYYDDGYSTAVPANAESFLEAKAHRKRVIYVGTNDGMLHAFLSGTYHSATGQYDTGTGEELFGFIPYEILPELNDFVPGDLTTHGYYVDSSPRVADVWIDTNGDGTKQSSEWRTVLIGGLRKGGASYYALDITDPPTSASYTNYPKVLWEYTNAALVGQTWSEPFIGKVRIQQASWSTPRDRWVAILGGGTSDDGSMGSSFLVMDIATGTPLKTFTTGIDNAIAASPTTVLDGNGYIKFAYAVDLDGSVYKFDFRNVGLASDGFAAWGVRKIFQAGSGQPAYHRVEPGSITESSRYLFFGTGDQDLPISNPGTGKFYAILDTDSFWPSSPLTESSLADVSSNITSTSGGTVGPSQFGWFVNFASGSLSSAAADSYSHSGEKVLSDPVVFYHNVFFTTFTADASDPCGGGGIARVYGLQMLNGGAALDELSSDGNPTGDKVPYYVYGGSEGGVPSSPSLSINPAGQSSIFVGLSTGGTMTPPKVKEIKIESASHMKMIKSWKETF